MFTRTNIYYIVTPILAMLLAACSTDDTMDEGVSGLAVSFDCAILDEADSDNELTRAADDPARELLTMQNTGFSVFASHNDATTLNFMYDQQVSFALPHYPDVTAHWEYSPQKYWPVPLGTLHFHAFAPYAPLTTADSGQEGIVGVSTTTGSEPVPQVRYRITTHAADNVNLLYACQDVTTPQLQLSFRHALARVSISVKTDRAPAADTRILLEHFTLESSTATPIATTATFALGTTPVWSNATTESSRTFTATNDRNDATAYAYVNSDVAYVEGLPAKWQPTPGLTTTPVDVLTLGDYVTYIYLIPQAELTLTCTAVYRVCHTVANTTDDPVTKTQTVTLSGDNALTTGRTIKLNFTLPI